MRHLSGDPVHALRWAEARNARPTVNEEGDLELVLPDDAFPAGEPLSWDEFAGVFTAEHLCFVWDDAPGVDFHAIGPEDRLRHLVEEVVPEHPPM